uniref:Uncharacterized protein n=1 Tax=Anopheles minimus TaxID=112268 RepID=A0A182WPH2_9DIPT
MVAHKLRTAYPYSANVSSRSAFGAGMHLTFSINPSTMTAGRPNRNFGVAMASFNPNGNSRELTASSASPFNALQHQATLVDN